MLRKNTHTPTSSNIEKIDAKVVNNVNTRSPTGNFTKQFGGSHEHAQIYRVKPDIIMRLSNSDIIKILQNPDKSKLSHEANSSKWVQQPETTIYEHSLQ